MDNLVVKPLNITSDKEFDLVKELYDSGFTPWYGNLPPRKLVNGLAKALPEAFLQIDDTATGETAGYIFTMPIFWNGDPATLETFDFYVVDRFRGNIPKELEFSGLAAAAGYAPGALADAAAKRLRASLLNGANTLMIMAMIIKPAYRGSKVSSLFFSHLAATVGPQLGFTHLVGPFRPSGFGNYKEANGLSLSQEVFDHYVTSTDAKGQPVDPWLKSAQKNGAQFLRTEIRSIRMTKSLAAFEKLKQTYKPGSWKETAEGVWECGEVPTWYVDKNLNRVFSLEPNLWGKIALK